MKKLLTTLLLSLAGLLCAWSQTAFPYPAVPDSVEQPQARLGFLLAHFWSCHRFDDASAGNLQVREQGFADFINLMQYADSATCATAAQALADSMAVSEQRQNGFSQLMERYLGNPKSPLRNDVTYAHLLRALTSRLSDAVAAKSRFAYRLSLVERNQPGTPATDFEYIDRRGACHRLYDTASPLTLIVFSDPECDHCRELMPRIIGDTTLLGDRRLTVLNIYPDANREAWETDVKALPPNWREGRSPEGEIMSRQLYALPALPALYLLDEGKRVLVKDGTLEQVVECLKTLRP